MTDRHQWTAKDDAALKSLIDKAYSYRQISAALGFSVDAIRGRVRTLRNRGAELAARYIWTPEMDDALMAMHNATPRPNKAEMARKVGVSHHAVSRRLARLTGHKPNSKPDYLRSLGVIRVQHGADTDRPTRAATIRLELAYLDAADRNGWPIYGYAA